MTAAGPRVTIGVPVRNGEALLETCLDCLSGQTYQDLEILVFDNASTDRTPEIVARAMAKDHRIRLIRHDKNIGIVANFLAALDASRAPYFMWRAYDDLSSANYVERLVAALDAHPEAMLATPQVETLRTESGKRRLRLPPAPELGPREPLARKRWILRQLQAGWVYGLYRREFLVDTYGFITREYHYAWAGDYLMLATFAHRSAIVGAPDATLTLQLTGAPKEYDASTQRQERMALVSNFWRVLEKLLAEQNLSWFQRQIFRLSHVWLLQRRVAKWPILLRVLLRIKSTY